MGQAGLPVRSGASAAQFFALPVPEPAGGRPMTKLIIRAVSMLVSVVGDLLAGAIFKKSWPLAAGTRSLTGT